MYIDQCVVGCEFSGGLICGCCCCVCCGSDCDDDGVVSGGCTSEGAVGDGGILV